MRVTKAMWLAAADDADRMAAEYTERAKHYRMVAARKARPDDWDRLAAQMYAESAFVKRLKEYAECGRS